MVLVSHFLTPSREESRIVAASREVSLSFLLFVRVHIWLPGGVEVAVAPGCLVVALVVLGWGSSGGRHGLAACGLLVVVTTLAAACCLPSEVEAWDGGRLVVSRGRCCVPDCSLVGSSSPHTEVRAHIVVHLQRREMGKLSSYCRTFPRGVRSA